MTPARIHQIDQDSEVGLPMLAANAHFRIVISEPSALCEGQRVMPINDGKRSLGNAGVSSNGCKGRCGRKDDVKC